VLLAQLAQQFPRVDARVMAVAKANPHRVVADRLDREGAQRTGSTRACREDRQRIARQFGPEFALLGRGRVATEHRDRDEVGRTIIPADREAAIAVEVDVERPRGAGISGHGAMLRSATMSDEGYTPVRASELPSIPGAPPGRVFAISHTVAVDETSALVPHANNIVILSWIDLAASLHGDAAGASRASLAASGRMWFVARHEIDYLGEAFVGDEVLLATWVEQLGRTSLTRATRIIRRRDGVELTKAISRWALVDLGTRRPTPIPEAVRSALVQTSPPSGVH
jgi:acyl-CoA thioester hydrolase